MFISNSTSERDFVYTAQYGPWPAFKKLWCFNLKPLKNKADAKYLEVGTFEGQSLIWVMTDILSEKSSSAVCVDAFFNSSRARVEHNLSVANLNDRVEIHSGLSTNILNKLVGFQFDLIFIDGDHSALGVLRDAIMSWPLLKDGGIMVFDDYFWKKWIYPSKQRPQAAIDFFIRKTKGHMRVLEKGPQVFLQKTSSAPLNFTESEFNPNRLFEIYLPINWAEKLHYYINYYYNSKYEKKIKL